MQRSPNIFALLANQAETGDLDAQLELRRQLEPEMIHVVRRVVDQGAGRSTVDRRILVEAQRLGLNARTAADAEGEWLIRAVARSVTRALVEGIRARSRKPLHSRETVCA